MLTKNLYFLSDYIFLNIFSYLDEDYIFNVFNINDNNKKNNFILNKYLLNKYESIYNPINKISHITLNNNISELKIINYLLQILNNNRISEIFINLSIFNYNIRNIIVEFGFNSLYKYLLNSHIEYMKNILNPFFVNPEKYYITNDKLYIFENECYKYKNYSILKYLIDNFNLDIDKISYNLFSSYENYVAKYKMSIIFLIEYNELLSDDIKKNIFSNSENILKLLLIKNFDICINLIKYIDETYYKLLFEHFAIKIFSQNKYGYEKYRNTNTIVIVGVLDKDQIVNDFIEIIGFLEDNNIYLSFSNFKAYLKYLYIDPKNDISSKNCCSCSFFFDDYCVDKCYSFYPSKNILEVKLKYIEYIYNRYKSYFIQPHYYYRDLLDNKKYNNIEHFIKMGMSFDNKTYKYILDNLIYPENIMIRDLLQNNIIQTNILFCHYYAATNNLVGLKLLYKYGFIINKSVLNTAIYNLSLDIIKYIYSECGIYINDKGYEILEMHSMTDLYFNTVEYIFQNILY